MRKHLSLIAASTALLSAPVVASAADWTGGYAGVQLGYANVAVGGGGGGSSDEFIGGLVGGYDYDLGTVVVGGGLDYDFLDDAQILRVKARGGFKVNNGLFYATAGFADLDVDGGGSEGGYFLGGGYEYLLTDSFSVGGEVLYHDFGTFDSGAEVEATTLQVRGTFRF